jgi:hypothetical protein
LAFICSFLVDRFAFPEYLVTLSVVILAAFIPSVIILAWFHGKTGPDQWTRVEKVAIPINVMIILIILVLFIRGKDLNALTTPISYKDESGEKVTVNLPRSEYRRSIALFYPENENSDSQYDWIGYAIVQLLDLDLDQDLFVQVISASQSMPFFQQNGFSEPENIPLTLMRQAASEQYAEFILHCRFSYADPKTVPDADLYNTEHFKKK